MTGPVSGGRPPRGPAVDFTDVTTMIDDTPVLFRLGLHLAPGTVTVLMGPSGSGKRCVISPGSSRPAGAPSPSVVSTCTRPVRPSCDACAAA
ncbi:MULTISPECIES: hypothetical protein [unclassified Pseudonocardia]|uniref:hypothetical protein n=1 Tax=unclassified Pseudonocardia TaxID=2619320 RepID=UPI001CF6EAC0|nr:MULTISPECIES: hypothetical protein [unclassified Pseudonocardia]